MCVFFVIRQVPLNSVVRNWFWLYFWKLEMILIWMVPLIDFVLNRFAIFEGGVSWSIKFVRYWLYEINWVHENNCERVFLQWWRIESRRWRLWCLPLWAWFSNHFPNVWSVGRFLGFWWFRSGNSSKWKLCRNCNYLSIWWLKRNRLS